MRIGRLSVEYAGSPWIFGADMGFCGCMIVNIGPFVVEWLRNGCYEMAKDFENRADK